MSGPRPFKPGGPGVRDLDNLILNLLQDDFPVSPRPYLALAGRLEAAEGISLS